jgi:hypothetical protein
MFLSRHLPETNFVLMRLRVINYIVYMIKRTYRRNEPETLKDSSRKNELSLHPYNLQVLLLWWGNTESTWYVGHFLNYCTSPGWWMMMSVEQSVEWMSGETCPGAALSTTNPTWLDLGSNPSRRGENPATNRLSGVLIHYFAEPPC